MGIWNVDNTKKFTHVSLCAGYGGIDIGLKRAIRDVRTITYVEIEAFAAANLVAKMEGNHLDAAPVWSDLKTFPWHLYSGKIDILSGGFPCQPFSAAGKGDADSDPRHLFPFIRYGILTAKPRVVFLENVEGIVSAKLKGNDWNDPAGTSVLLHVIRELERLGYKATAVPVSASEVGAPHQRNRWFIVGVANSNGRGGWKDIMRSKLRSTRLEQSSGCTRVCSETGEKRKIEAWPKAPGPGQFKWEPSRTVGKYQEGQNKELGHTSSNNQRGESEPTMYRERQQVGGSGSGELGDTTSERSQNRGSSPLGECKGEIEKLELSNSELANSGGSKSKGLQRSEGRQQDIEAGKSSRDREIEPEMGGNSNGNSNRLDYAELCSTSDNRTDELRMCGNGVMPQYAEDAYRYAMNELLTGSDSV